LLEGRICPRCRFHEDQPALVSPIARCPKDGHALVALDEFTRADGDPFLGATVADRFVILGKLGAGSMGTVYRARQEPMGRDVAIKILRSDRAFDAHAKTRFTREARAMSLLRSPHTVTVFDFGEIPDHGDELAPEGTSLYLAMELLLGESLGARLKKQRQLPSEEAAWIARHALLSLAEAHDKGIVHRDLKPDNLFLTQGADQQEICKVLDFGIAKVTSEHSSVDALETQAGTVFGTPRYMSPEQAQGKPLDARSDLYSLGVMLYHMLVGRPPFTDEDAVVVMARHIKSIPVAPIVAAPDAPIGAALSTVVMRALAKDPTERYGTARQFIEELERALAEPRSVKAISVISEGSSVAMTGEMPVLVRDDLDAVPSRPGPALARRSRFSLLFAGTAFTLALGVFFAFGPLVGRERPELLQKELARNVRTRLALASEAVASAQALDPPPIEPAAPPIPQPTWIESAAPPPPPPPRSALPSAKVAPPRAPVTAPWPASSVKKPNTTKNPSYKRFD
jgi:eukaryotic-like serine/threonine-protein kinase